MCGYILMDEFENIAVNVFDALLSSLVVADKSSGIILKMNKAAHMLLGAMEGQNYQKIFELHSGELPRIDYSNNINKFQLTLKTQSGATMFIDGSLLVTHYNDREYMIFEFSDGTDEQMTRKLLTERIEYEKAVSEIATRLMDITLFESNILTILEEISYFTSSDQVSIFSIDHEHHKLSCLYEWTLNDSLKNVGRKIDVDIIQLESWLRTMSKNNMVYLNDVELLPEEAESEKEFLKARGIRSIISLPFYHGDLLIGFLGIEFMRATLDWTPNNVELLKIVSAAIGNALIRKKNYDKLKENYEFLSILINTIPEPIFYKDLHGCYIGYNQSFVNKVIGHSDEKFIGKPLPDRFLKDNSSFEDDQKAIAEGTLAYEKRIKCGNGEERDFMIYKSVFHDAAGNKTGIVGIMVDITEKNNWERELLKFLTAVNQSGNSIMITNAEPVIEYVNSAFTAMTGYEAGEVLDKNPGFLSAGGRFDIQNSKIWSSLVEGKEWKGEFVNKKKNGEIYFERAFITPIKSISGEIVNFIKIADDISVEKELKREHEKLQKELAEAEKMFAIGELSAGVAHEFNNILAVIKSTVQVILLAHSLGEYQLPGDVIDELKSIDKSTKRAADIAGNLMIIARPVEPVKDFYKISEIIDEVLKFQKNQFEMEGITILRSYHDVEPVYVDKNQIQQVFLNLSINARHALKNSEQKEINVVVTGTHELVSVMFGDTGCGIPENIIDKIFLPFFTTKGASSKDANEIKGTGLGLSVTKSIIKNNKGTISVVSKEGAGTTFTITLPAMAKYADQRLSAQTKDRILEKRVFCGEIPIVLIDHDKDILNKTKKMMTDLGYTNLSLFVSSHEFRLLFRANMFSIMIVDYTLFMSNTFYESIHAIDPQIKFIIISGTGELTEMKENVIGFLRKPFDMFDLIAMVDACSCGNKKG